MKKKKILNIPLDFSVDTTFDDERFLKTRVRIMHTGLNRNHSNFSKSVVEKAKSTISNIPLLAFIKKVDGEDSADFGGHEIEFKITADGYEEVYLGRPIGLIPTDNNYQLVEEEGILYVEVDGYVWKNYANEALKIIQESGEKSVSMEILVDDYEVDEGGVFDITDYKYNGICVLGDSVRPGMAGAHLKVAEYTQDSVSELREEFAAYFSEKEQKQQKQESEQQEQEQEEQQDSNKTCECDTCDCDFSQQELKLQTRIGQLSTELIQKDKEIQELKEFKQKTELKEKSEKAQNLFNKFTDLEKLPQYQKLIKSDISNMDLEQLELQLFALRGQHVSTEQETQDKVTQLKQFNHGKKEELQPWQRLVAKHKTKEEK